MNERRAEDQPHHATACRRRLLRHLLPLLLLLRRRWRLRLRPRLRPRLRLRLRLLLRRRLLLDPGPWTQDLGAARPLWRRR